MKKKNFIIIIVIMLIFIGLCFLTVYKLKKYNKNYNIIKLSDEIVESNINFKEEYEEYIVDSSYFTSINFPINIDKHIVYYIFEKKENNLYIKNTDTNEEKKLLDEKIKSFSLVTNDETDEFMYIYLITKEGNFYKVELKSHNPIKLNIEKLNKKIEVDSFLTGVEYGTYRDIPNYSIPVFDTNDKIYIMPTESLFIPNMVMVKDKLIIYEDKKISSIEGKLLKNQKKENYLVKWIFEITSENPFENKPEILIITEDNKIIYLFEDEIYEYKKNIKDVLYSKVTEDTGILYLEFDDDTKMEFDIMFDKRYFGFITK